MQENAAAGGKKGCFRFKRKERLKKRNDIRDVFGHGRRISCYSAGQGGGAKLFLLKNNLSCNRICFTFPRGFGTAVERNRARRLGREAYRLLRSRITAGYDLVVLVYAPRSVPADKNTAANPETLVSRIKQFEFLFAKAGLLI